MKTSQRHHLKENEFAIMLRHAGEFTTRNQRTLTMLVTTIALLAIAAGAFFAWRNSVESKSHDALAQAMVVFESRVAPPVPGLNGQPPTQQANTFPTQKAKLEAALPKFIAAADAYPSTEAGRMARYHAAAALVELGRYDEAIKQYDQVIGGGGLLSQSARMGKGEAQLRAKQPDAAISTIKEVADKSDSGLPQDGVLLQLARAYLSAGKTDDARKTLTQIVEQHGDSPFASEARRELDKIKS